MKTDKQKIPKIKVLREKNGQFWKWLFYFPDHNSTHSEQHLKQNYAKKRNIQDFHAK